MSESKHTKGPWYCETDHEGEPERWAIYRKEEPHYSIAVIENGAPGDSLDTEEATANLIAAAPDMLEALEELQQSLSETAANYRKFIKRNAQFQSEYNSKIKFLDTQSEKAKAVIAKAKGES